MKRKELTKTFIMTLKTPLVSIICTQIFQHCKGTVSVNCCGMEQQFIVLRPFSKRGLEIGVTPPHGRTKHNHIFLIA